MDNKLNKFIQSNSPDGGFLQSDHWRCFQESVGRKTNYISAEDEGEVIASANILTHVLPVVGNYFYVPRGFVLAQNAKRKTQNQSAKLKIFFSDLAGLAKNNNIGWIRVEPNSEEELELIRANLLNGLKIKKSSVDMQPREILVLDIARSEEEILAGMKQKTRYNIRLAEKKGIKISFSSDPKHIDEFLKLVKITAERDKITSHPKKYYRKMFETIPSEILKLYVAEYQDKTIAANLILFFGKTATYMHGASDSEYREVMAPHALQWRQIMDAKKDGCERYDFGGVKVSHDMPARFESRSESGGVHTTHNNWGGITRFKTGFAPNVEPIQFPGSYDIILKPGRYNLYRALQKIKKIFK
jgi:lipid II:glycine glycyltransferase (peptidoglycan interpeptide bridge formation enzyme)